MTCLVPGCSEDELPVVARGRYVEIATERDEVICGGTVAFMDRFIEEGFALIGETPPDEVFVRYEWVEGAAGRVNIDRGRSRITTDDLVSEHELAHAVHGPWPRGQAFLEEGFAVLLDPHRAITGWIQWPQGLPLDDVLAARYSRDVPYPEAWYLVSQIVADHGMTGLRDLWHAVPRGASAQEVRDAYRSLFGRSIEVLLEPWVYQSEDPELDGEQVERYACTYTLCTGEPRPWTGDIWTATGPRGCEDDPSAIGPFERPGEPPGPIWTDHVFDAENMPFDTDPTSTATRVQIRLCSLDCIQSTAYDWGQGPAPDEPWRTRRRRRIELHVEPEALPTDEPEEFRYLRP